MNLRPVFFAGLLVLACKNKESTAADPNAPTRGFRMGFSAFAPKFDAATVLTVINQWSARGDAALFHQSPP